MRESLLSTLVIALALAGLAILRVGRRARDHRQARQHELVLLRLGEARGRQEILDEVRMLEHGQLKAHILALQHCLTLARDAATPEQRASWLDEGLTQTRRLLEVVVMLHQAVGSSALPSDLECTLADVAQSLAVAYPACACRVEVSGQRPAHLGEPIQRALILVLYNALSNAYHPRLPSDDYRPASVCAGRAHPGGARRWPGNRGGRPGPASWGARAARCPPADGAARRDAAGRQRAAGGNPYYGDLPA
jgi:hypothetical protein